MLSSCVHFGARSIEGAESGEDRSDTHSAMRRKRTHAQFFAERQGLPIARFSTRRITPAFVHRDIAEQFERPSLVPPFLILLGELEGAFR